MVALIGLNSLYGHASSLLLKLCPNIYNLRLYDETDTSAADDIKIINTPCTVQSYKGKTKLNDAIKGSDIVLIGDDILSTPQTCFDVMAPKMQDYAKAIAESSPNALIIVAASPVNKLVPVLSELLQENGFYDCNKVMGTTASINVRANCILASYVNTDPRTVFLPVVGGDSEDTIVPLFSQAKPHFNISEAVMKRLIEDIKQASPIIYHTKGSTEALNKAHATVKFLNTVIAGLRGEPNIMNIAFTKTTQVDGTEYFALPVLFGRFGIQARYGIPRILPFENDLISQSVFCLQKDTEFAKLFCKTRETAAETCSRNVAIRYRKSKEFEQFVNGLKMNKKETMAEDKIVDKIKPPIPVESGQLTGDKLFDPKSFCLKLNDGHSEKNRIIPAYMKGGESIMPVSLGYTFGNNNGIPQFVPTSSANTQICEPIVCPDRPKEKEINYTNLVSLVERLVKNTTEKMIKEKEKDEILRVDFKALENSKARSEKYKNINPSPDEIEQMNECSRKFDMLRLKSENVRKIKPNSDKAQNLSRKTEKHETNFSQNSSIINMSNPFKDRTDIVDKNSNQIGKVNLNKKIGDKINPPKRKYPEKTLESIFGPTVCTFKERFDYKSGIKNVDNSNEFKQAETKQNNVGLNNKMHAETCVAMHPSYNAHQRVFNFKPNKQSQNPYIIVSSSNNSNSGENNNFRNTNINKSSLNQNEDTIKQPIEKNFKVCQNISTIETELNNQTLIHTSNHLGKGIAANISSTNITKNNSDKSDSLKTPRNKKLLYAIPKVENKVHIGDKYKTIFGKREHIFDKMNYDNDPFNNIKDDNYMKNLLIGNLNNSIKKEYMFYDKINKKYELLVKKNLHKITNKNIGNFKNLLNDKSCKSTKDFVRNQLRSKYSINKSANNRSAIWDKNKISVIAKTENNNKDFKSNDEIKSVCYNAFSNEVTKIKNTVEKCGFEVISPSNNQYANKNGKIENNLIIPSTKGVNLTTSPKNDKKQTDISQENERTMHYSKDFDMLMKTLNSDVFNHDEKINTNFTTNEENNQVKLFKNDLSSSEEQNPDLKLSNQGPVAEECKTSSMPDRKEKVSTDLITINTNENSEPTEITFENVIKEIKLALQPSNHQNKLDNMNDLKEDEKSNIGKYHSEIENLVHNNKEEINEGFDPFPQNGEAIEKKGSIISKNNMTLEPIPVEKESVKNQIGFNNVEASKINSDLQNIPKSSDKTSTNFNKCFQDKCTQTKVSSLTNDLNSVNKVSITTSDRFSSTKTRESRNNKNVILLKRDSVNYIKSLRRSSKLKENIKLQKKNARQESLKVKIKNLNYPETPKEPLKQKNARNKNLIQSRKQVTPLSKFSKSFISSKYNSLISKKKNTTEMQGYFTGLFGHKVNEINNAEHSFSLRDKNGINNYFLLKGLLPKIKNNKQHLENYNGSLSLLKTNVCNEDPFMSIKDKQINKIKGTNEKLLKHDLKKIRRYTSNGSNSEYDPLLITHNTVYCPNCPVHGYKPYIGANNGHNKSISPTNKCNVAKINEAMLSNLCRMCNKVRGSEKNSPHQLNQKTQNFKLYSTSALPIKNKSPSCVEKKKTVQQLLMSKNESSAAKLPKGFIKKQRITKILEKGSKKSNPQTSSKYKTSEMQSKETNTFTTWQPLLERKTIKKPCPFHPQAMSRTTKIDENVFSLRFDSSYISRYLKTPPKYLPHRELFCSNDQKYRNSPKSRKVADIYKINWSDSQSNTRHSTSSVPVENDILVRGTCLDHVRNKFVSNKTANNELSNDAYSDEKKTVVNSMKPSSLSNAFMQYTKDNVKCEYPKDEKFPSIRQLHKFVFPSN